MSNRHSAAPCCYRPVSLASHSGAPSIFVSGVYRNEPVNRGKGWCLRQGIGLASGQVVVVHDADLECDPTDHAAMLEPILDDRADVVYGSRFLTGVKSTSWWHRGANRELTRLMNLCSGLRLTDLHTGLKMFRTDLLRGLPLVEDRFGFCPEVTARLAKVPGVRWAEVPVSYRPRTRAQGKKIRFKDGLRAVYCILRYTWPWRRSVDRGQRSEVSRQSSVVRGQRSEVDTRDLKSQIRNRKSKTRTAELLVGP